jgi:integrase/recombinase XerD
MSPSVDTPQSEGGRRAPTDLERELERYLRYVTLERGRSKNTVAAYRSDLQRYLEWLAGVGVTRGDGITTRRVSDYVNALPGSATTVARKLSSIKNFHRFLVEEGVLGVDPSMDVPAPKLPQRLPKALTINQVQALLEGVLGDDPTALRDRALLEFLYATGARISEALALSIDDVLGDNAQLRDTIRVTGKGQKERLVPVGSYARAALEAYLVRARPVLIRHAKKATPAVFLGSRGGALSRQNAWLILQSAANRAELSGLVSPHTLRHSFATHVLAGGADIRVVQELLGHSSVHTTQIYTKVTIDTLKDVYLSAHPRAR